MSPIVTQSGTAGRSHDRAGLFHRHVRDNEAVKTGGRGLGDESLHTNAVHDRVGEHGRQSAANRRTHRVYDSKDVLHTMSSHQRMIEGTPNDGAIGDGIGVRHADLDDRGTDRVRRLNEFAGRG